MSKANLLQAADLFSGLGGFTLALEQLGQKTLYATDNDEKAAATYSHNFPQVYFSHKDITRPSETDYQTPAAELADFPHNLLTAGFPCQSFSRAGRQLGLRDHHGHGQVLLSLLDLIDQVHPPIIFFENVSRLTTIDQGSVLRLILTRLKNARYHLHFKVLDASEYGNLPQQRQRFYLVAFANHQQHLRFHWPEPIPLTHGTFDLLEPPETLAPHYYYGNTPLWQEQFQYFAWQKDLIYLWRRNQRRQYPHGITPTLMASMGTGGHNVPLVLDSRGVRKLTPRECLRLQGFPDSFTAPSFLSEKDFYRQIGNSLALPVVQRILQQILQTF